MQEVWFQLMFMAIIMFKSENSIMRNTDIDKTIKKMKDSFLHYDNMLKTIQTQDLSNYTKENLKIYYTNSILVKLRELPKDLQKQFVKEFKKRKMAKNIKSRNIKQLIKKLILTMNISLYLKKIKEKKCQK